ncbi:class I SAM-dependent DNA methyltransferase [Paratractidigestivibacter sp.]|uniref:type I restriction-modification system subunit M n=1 Tax=Paratractidigestivibacter sp. TaxID=2847316 RepID=UPI002AC89B51|nr:class I SAM-dependent DNA methyltransferase [Paratractidigestivibacter sp.]
MPTSDELIKAVGANIQEKASLIWSVADTLRGPYKPHEYGLVILPMTVIKRFHDCLAPTHDKVLAEAEAKKDFAVKDGFLRKASGYPFYNTSKFTFETLKADPENIEDNFRDYVNGFSENIQDILARMKFADQIERLSDPDAPLLYQVVCDFCKPQADMSPDKITAVDMGYIFENLIQRFSESYDEDAGAHFTSRDIVYLMTELLVAADPHVFEGERITKTVYDQTMGTSQMLGCTEERLRQLDADARVALYGQEFNPFTYGIAKASALIRGEDDTNMRFGDTLSNDQFDGFKFDYCISNPPFGDAWNSQAPSVEKEHKQAGGGRFPVEKLPAKGDGQMLFVLNGLSKLKDDGVMAIIQDASPLYKGKPGGGEDSIRRYVLENDWLDAIIQLPSDSFYNTGIATYVWLFSKGKAPEHADKVLLVDASQCFEKRRKGIGYKKNDITGACRELIVRAYSEYRDGAWEAAGENGQQVTVEARLMQSVEFGFNRVCVQSPVPGEDGEPLLNKRGQMQADKAKEDTEDIPLTQDIDAYIEREVRPYNPYAWVDKKKTKVGYTIPFTRVFYKYAELEPSADIAQRILEHEKTLEASLEALFGGGR